MDTKATVDRSHELPPSVWNDGTATDMQAAQDCHEGRRSKLAPTSDAAASDRADSPDPLRHTDLYRLVMPYRDRI